MKETLVKETLVKETLVSLSLKRADRGTRKTDILILIINLRLARSASWARSNAGPGGACGALRTRAPSAPESAGVAGG